MKNLEILYTRQDYLNGVCSHNQYYSQFVTGDILKLVENKFGYIELKNAFYKDVHLNSIPLSTWDQLGLHVKPKMNKYGDWLTMSSKVCILKVAAKIIIYTYGEAKKRWQKT